MDLGLAYRPKPIRATIGLGPVSDEYLAGCLARVGECELAIPLLMALEDWPDDKYPWDFKNWL